MRVLHVAPSFHPALVYGGPTRSTFDLCRALARRGAEIRVLTTHAAGPRAVLAVDTSREVSLAPGITARYCPRDRPEDISLTLLRLLPEYVRWATVVHLTAVYSFPTIPTLLACNAGRRPVVWSPRGALQRWEGGRNRRVKDAWDWICRAAAPRPRTTLCFTSEEEAAESTARFGGYPFAIVPNGVDLPLRVARDEEPSSMGETPTYASVPAQPAALRLGFLGRLHPIKGIENLLLAVANLTARSSVSVTLTLAGGGEPAYEASLRARIAALGIGDRARMIGPIDGEAKRAFFEGADVVVVPSFRESFGNVVIEALAHDVPVIAGRGTPWRRLEDEGAGLWVDNDPAALAAAIERIAGMPRREMGRRGRALVERELTWERVAPRMEEVYRRALDRSDQSGPTRSSTHRSSATSSSSRFEKGPGR